MKRYRILFWDAAYWPQHKFLGIWWAIKDPVPYKATLTEAKNAIFHHARRRKRPVVIAEMF